MVTISYATLAIRESLEWVLDFEITISNDRLKLELFVGTTSGLCAFPQVQSGRTTSRWNLRRILEWRPAFETVISDF
jgi:hypothetical protein